MAINQKFEEFRVNSLPDSNLKAGDRYYLNVGKKQVMYIVSDSLELIRDNSSEFIEKDTMQEMRNLSTREIWALQNNIYKGVKLNGYYVKGDTYAPIEYYLSNITKADDGGAVIEVNGVKFFHDFNKIVNVSYYGAKGDGLFDNFNVFKKAIDLNIPVEITGSEQFYYIGGRLTLKNSILGVNNPIIKTSIDANNFYQPDNGPTVLDRYTAFSIVNKISDEFWFIDGLTIDGQYDGIHGHQTSPAGTVLTEFEHNIHISASKNIVIQNCVLKNPVGDNIYLGRNTANQGDSVLDYCENIIIRNNTMTNPYRCNIAFVSVKQCEVYENICDKTWEYVKPFDLEPNGGDRRLICRNINIYSNSITFTGDYAILIFGATDSTYSNESFPNLTYSTKDINIYNNMLKARDAAVRCHYSQASVSNIIVDNNIIDSDLFVSGSGTGTYYVRNLIVKNNKNVSINKTKTRIASISRAINVEVSNNQIKDITSAGSSGIQMVNIQSAKITNNKITGTNTIPAIRIAGTSSDISIENNTLESNISCIRVNSGTILENLKIKDNYLMSVTENPIFSDTVNIDKCNISGNVWDYQNKNLINSSTYFSGGISEQNQGRPVLFVNQLPDAATLTNNDNGTIFKLYRKSNNAYLNSAVGSMSYMFLNGLYIGLDFIGEFQGEGQPAITSSILKNGQRYINYSGGFGNTTFLRESSAWRGVQVIHPTTESNKPLSPAIGYRIFNTTKGCPEWWNGSTWLNPLASATPTTKGVVNQSGASPDTATAPSATYTQAEVQAILTELRDLKTKLRTAGILAT